MANNRDYKKFIQGNFYHVYNRGTAKMDIFLDSDDFIFFLGRLKETLSGGISLDGAHGGKSHTPYKRKQLPLGAFTIAGYCLMPNHFHLLIRQNGDTSISTFMLKLATGYSKYFNKKYDRVGTLFQDQFKVVVVESDEQFHWLVNYIHNNPLKSGLVQDAKDYPWTSLNDVLQ